MTTSTVGTLVMLTGLLIVECRRMRRRFGFAGFDPLIKTTPNPVPVTFAAFRLNWRPSRMRYRKPASTG